MYAWWLPATSTMAHIPQVCLKMVPVAILAYVQHMSPLGGAEEPGIPQTGFRAQESSGFAQLAQCCFRLRGAGRRWDRIFQATLPDLPPSGREQCRRRPLRIKGVGSFGANSKLKGWGLDASLEQPDPNDCIRMVKILEPGPSQ